VLDVIDTYGIERMHPIREGRSRLCTKTPTFPLSFVQDGILHKKVSL
jgi:hypothetical protein